MYNESEVLKTLQKIAGEMERIANALEKNGNTNMQIPQVAPLLNSFTSNEVEDNSLERVFFEMVTNIYTDEERIKVARNLKKKAATRIATELGNQISAFFNGNLDNLHARPVDRGYIALSKNEIDIALFRFQTDLGFTRGDRWEEAIVHAVETADTLGIADTNVFFLVGTIKNSLENAHIKRLLRTNDVPDNSTLITNAYRPLLEEYLQAYVESISALPNPAEQIYFLTAGEHPNDIGIETVANNTPYPKNINWLKPSVSELINVLQTL
ncbi:hypothetical protein ACFVP8_21835 [Viridibacillus arvi]|uniref:hypothetical protein n=1 Tax=Viridibacillus arvi TaxID=263475 RepID=UPI00367D96AF